MLTRLEYILEFTRTCSSWLETSIPALNYIVVKDSILPNYPTTQTENFSLPFKRTSLSSFNINCNDCFDKAYKDYEAELKQLNVDYDDSGELMDIGLDICLYDFLAGLTQELAVALIMFLLVRVQAAFPKPNPINTKIKDLIDKFKKAYGINSKPGLRGFDTQTHLGWFDSKRGRTAKDAPQRWWRQAAAQKEQDWLIKGGSGPEPRPPIPFSLEKSFRDVVREIRKQFTTPDAWINFLKDLLSGFVQYLIDAGMACIMLDQVADLFNVFNNALECMNKECQDNAERCKNNLAAKYVAVDKYFNSLSECTGAGCCVNSNSCKGIGGWCTRIRDGADFSFYIPCCSNCNCGDDPECKYAFCSSCNPDSKCPGKEDDLDTNDTQSNSLPNYLFAQDPPAHLQNCPPLPPGWKRHPNGDPDPRSSPEWDPALPPPCIVDEVKSAVQNSLNTITNYWSDVCKKAGSALGIE